MERLIAVFLIRGVENAPKKTKVRWNFRWRGCWNPIKTNKSIVYLIGIRLSLVELVYGTIDIQLICFPNFAFPTMGTKNCAAGGGGGYSVLSLKVFAGAVKQTDQGPLFGACAFTMSYPAATSRCVGVQSPLNNTYGYRYRPGHEYKG